MVLLRSNCHFKMARFHNSLLNLCRGVKCESKILYIYASDR